MANKLGDIIIRPIISEKSSLAAENASYVFEVLKTATKVDIRNAVQQLFGVKVKSVNTVKLKGKVRKMGKAIGRVSNIKKAYVSLQPGYRIEKVGA